MRCGISAFELSFAAVVGTVAGNACIRRMRDAHDRRFWAGENLQKAGQTPVVQQIAEGRAGSCRECLHCRLRLGGYLPGAGAAGPERQRVGGGLQHRGAVDGAAAAFCWGLAVTFVGLVPWLAPVHGVLSRAADLLTGLLNGWAVWLSTKPGASIYFNTAYAALVCLLLCGLGVLAFRWRVRLRVALPGILLAAAVGIRAGQRPHAGTWCTSTLWAAPTAPAVVIAQNDRAVVLFRGGNAAQRAEENQLARRGVRTVELVADLRMNAKTRLHPARAADIRAERLPVGTQPSAALHPGGGGTCAPGKGCLVRLTVGNRQVAVVKRNGDAELAKRVRGAVADRYAEKAGDSAVPKLWPCAATDWMPPEKVTGGIHQPAPHRRLKTG